MTGDDIAAMTARSALSRILALATGGFDVVIGTVKAPGTAKGFYVALEHLELSEPEEFQGGNIETALCAASVWAAERAMGSREPAPAKPMVPVRLECGCEGVMPEGEIHTQLAWCGRCSGLQRFTVIPATVTP